MSDDVYVLPPSPPPEQIEARPHRLTLILGVAALIVSVAATGFSGFEACEAKSAREAATRSAAAAEKSAREAEQLNRLTEAGLESAKQAAAAAKQAAGAADQQAIAANRQTLLASRAAQAAMNANALAQESMRARVAASGAGLETALAVGEHPVGLVEVSNRGHTEAVDLVIHTMISITSALPIAMPDIRLQSPPSRLVLGPEETSTSNVRSSVTLTPEILADLKAQRLHLYVFGRFAYSSLGKNHGGEFCFEPILDKGRESNVCPQWNRVW